MTPTKQQAAKIQAAIADEQRRLAAEMKISEDLRNVDRVNRLTAHIDRLFNMLKTGEGLPKPITA